MIPLTTCTHKPGFMTAPQMLSSSLLFLVYKVDQNSLLNCSSLLASVPLRRVIVLKVVLKWRYYLQSHGFPPMLLIVVSFSYFICKLTGLVSSGIVLLSLQHEASTKIDNRGQDYSYIRGIDHMMNTQ